MKYLITAAAVVAALLTVLSTRLLIPALILVYRYIEQSFAPTDEPLVVKALPIATAPVVVTEAKPAPKKRATRKRTAQAKIPQTRDGSSQGFASTEEALAGA